MPKPSGAGPDQLSGSESSVRRFSENFVHEAAKRLALSAVVVCFSVVAVIFFGVWEKVRTAAAEFVITVVSRDMESVGGRTSIVLDDTIKSVVDGTIGTVNSGIVQLSAASNEFALFIYFPPNHEGDLYVSLDGIEAGERVVLNAGIRSRSFDSNATFSPIPISSLIQPGIDPQSEAVMESTAAVLSGIMQDTYAITFRLSLLPDVETQQFSSSGSPQFKSRVKLRYLALISPPIRKDNG